MAVGWSLLPSHLRRCPSAAGTKSKGSNERPYRQPVRAVAFTARVADVARRAASPLAPAATADNVRDPTSHAAALSRLLGLPQPRLISLLERCPDLFAFSPEALAATLGAVAELTGLQPHQLPQLATADPSLLLQPDRLKRNMRALAEALCVPPAQLPSLLAREPSLLALSGPVLAERLAALQELLLGPHPSSRRPAAVLAAARDSPGSLLLLEPWELEQRVMALEAAMDGVMAAGSRGSPGAARGHHQPQAGEACGTAPRATPPAAPRGAATTAAVPSPPPPGEPGVPTRASSSSSSPSCSGPSSSATTTMTTEVVTATSSGCGCGPGSALQYSAPLAGSTHAGSAGPPQQQQQQHHHPPSASPGPQPPPAPAEPLRRLLSPLLLARPSLLSAPPGLLAERAAHLAARAGASVEQVLAAAPANPNLLAISSCHLDRHCTAMAAALAPVGALPPYRAPRITPTPAASTSPPSTSSPTDTPSRSTAPASAANGHACSCGPDAAPAPQPPPLPLSPPRPLPAASAPRPPEGVAAAMLLAAPRLLNTQVGALVAKWQLLAALCGRAAAPAWADRLAAASVAERAELLDLPYTVLARLRFLADHGLQSEVDPLEAVRASDELFQLQYPQYKMWLRG